jgi:hypothetical protein
MRSIKETYRQFLNTDKGTNLYNGFKRILYTDDDSLVQTLDNSILQNFSLFRKRSLRVCDVGGGDGRRIVRILKYLNTKFQNHFRLDFIEQSKQYVTSFDTTSISSFCEIRKYHTLFENVSLPEKHYDLVLLIHSIFAFENGRALDKVLALPSKNGRVVVVSNAANSFLGGLKTLVDEGYDDQRYEIDALKQDLDKRNIKYQCLTFQTRWAVDNACIDECLYTILQWITLGSYETFSAEKKQSLDGYIHHNTTVFEGRTFFTEDEIVLVIPSF